jgi:hypothetical protein
MVDFPTLLKLLDKDEFSEIFIEKLGWNRPTAQKLTINFGEEKFELIPVAQFKGIQVWSCKGVPNARIQREIDREISKVSAERLTVFHNQKLQNWRWPMSREATGRGIVRLVNHEHIKGQNTLSLLQRFKLIEISIDLEEPSLVDILLKLRKAFDAEQVTKKFYKEFSFYQKNIVNQISGLEQLSDKEWYSSLLLNRIMFIYFMQWKGFMDGNQNYLADRLQKIKELKGPNNFFGFFKDFLLPLFHKGLGAGTEIKVPVEIAKIVGEIPYVNGGIFSEHELEMHNEIDLPDEAFAEIFEFFDNYQWHLDSRATGNPNEINPDVLGYVFEQFVNNKDQGAFYTKEDITEYMTSNTLIIGFLKKINAECQINLFRPLVQNPERYIWPSIKFGEDCYTNQSEPESIFSLPGESIFETRERLHHLKILRNLMANGKIDSIADLITLNIDLELLASDIIDGLDTSEDVIKIWNILSSLKILDPTCGSGAFLFAALKQLEALYLIVLDVAEIHSRTNKNSELKNLLEEVKKHPNRNYFVLKHASQKNLYGVDIMREATEIARLRLFLKLMSAIDNYEDIEPLPDLEFNIKSGNLLIGITKSSELPNYLTTLDAMLLKEDIENQVIHLADLWYNFISSQELGFEKSQISKKLLANGIKILKTTLDKLFYETVVGDRNKQSFEDWKEISLPFHWFVEFPDVFQGDGFDVVIGNPPYIKKSKVSYALNGHYTSDCPDIYAMCMERASLITNSDGTFAMIIMLNLAFGERYEKLRDFLTKKFPMRWISGYGNRPSMLFENVEVRNTIFIGTSGNESLHSAPMHRWSKNYRPHLMSNIKYSKVPSKSDNSEIWPFITSIEVFEILSNKTGNIRQEVLNRGPKLEFEKGVPKWDVQQGNMAPLFYMGTARYWISCFKVAPPAEDGDGNPVISTKLNSIWFRSPEIRDIAFTLYVSKWMYSWWTIYGDDFDVTKEILLSFPIDFTTISSTQSERLIKLAEELQTKMMLKVNWQKVTFPDKRVIKVGNWDLSKCKEILNQIDQEWTEILGATKLVDKLNFQYYSSVKATTEIEA